jgi:hypothetical protein
MDTPASNRVSVAVVLTSGDIFCASLTLIRYHGSSIALKGPLIYSFDSEGMKAGWRASAHSRARTKALRSYWQWL